MDTGQEKKRNDLKMVFVGLVIAIVGMLAISGGYVYAESPQFCGTCHAMDTAYTTWQHSNHKQMSCTECHLPNKNLAVKLVAKAQTGITDVYHETIRDYPAKIMVSPQGKAYIADNCLRCHQSTVETTGMGAGGQDCTKCHRGLVHERGSVSKGGIKYE